MKSGVPFLLSQSVPSGPRDAFGGCQASGLAARRSYHCASSSQSAPVWLVCHLIVRCDECYLSPPNRSVSGRANQAYPCPRCVAAVAAVACDLKYGRHICRSSRVPHGVTMSSLGVGRVGLLPANRARNRAGVQRSMCGSPMRLPFRHSRCQFGSILAPI